MNTETTPRIYVACLAAYNNGTLHGTWIDATQGADGIREAIAAMLAASPEPGAEEWAIHDHEGFEGVNIGEYADIEKVAEHAAMLEKHGSAWAAYCDHVGEDYATAQGFEDSYRGEWDSEGAFAENLIEDLGELKDDSLLSRYFDHEAFTRDLFINDYYYADGHVFDRNV